MKDCSRDITSPIPVVRAEGTKRRRRTTVLQFGDYRVIGLISRGGTCGVYLAANTNTHERVALKILDPHWDKHDDLVERMFEEQQIAASVSHAGLLAIHSAGRSLSGTPYLVMELLDGENLGELVERGRVVVGAIASIGAQVASAVGALHDAEIIHCDLKPENVFLLYETGLQGWPRIKVIDYGVSQRTAVAASETIAGTPSCMAPEQWRGAPTTKSDVYALGCTLYWLATGMPPFTGALPQLMVAHTQRLPARPSTTRDLPQELDRIIVRALAKDPGMRPTMREMARDLAALAAQYPTTATVELLEAVG